MNVCLDVDSLVQMTKQQIDEKVSAVTVLKNAPGVDRDVSRDIDTTLTNVIRLYEARERALHKALQLVSHFIHGRLYRVAQLK